jgi:hypothetical protein
VVAKEIVEGVEEEKPDLLKGFKDLKDNRVTMLATIAASLRNTNQMAIDFFLPAFFLAKFPAFAK